MGRGQRISAEFRHLQVRQRLHRRHDVKKKRDPRPDVHAPQRDGLEKNGDRKIPRVVCGGFGPLTRMGHTCANSVESAFKLICAEFMGKFLSKNIVRPRARQRCRELSGVGDRKFPRDIYGNPRPSAKACAATRPIHVFDLGDS